MTELLSRDQAALEAILDLRRKQSEQEIYEAEVKEIKQELEQSGEELSGEEQGLEQEQEIHHERHREQEQNQEQVQVQEEPQNQEDTSLNEVCFYISVNIL